MRIPAILDLHAWKNAEFSTTFAIFENGVPYDLTGLTGTALEMKVRVQPGQTGTALATCNLSSGASIVNATGGTVLVNIVAATLSAMPAPDPFNPTKYFWDLLISPVTGLDFVAIEGAFWLHPGVTRA